MRKKYTAPEAQMMLLVPCETVASWSRGTNSDSWWWSDGTIKFWRDNNTAPSAPTGTLIYDPTNNEYKLD